MDDVDFLTPRQVAERCQISYKTVLRAIAAGDLEAYEIAGRKRIPVAAYETWARRAPTRRADAPRAPRRRGAAGPGSDERLLAIERDASARRDS